MPVVITAIITASAVIAVILMVTMVTPTFVFLVTPARVASILVITPVTAILAKDSSGQRHNEYERK
jgi:hypothetical protein